jgi:small neutral amino acid transporter SnatA (MarC family)
MLSWLPIARDLSHKEQRRVAWRITWVGFILVTGIMILGFFTVRNVAPQREFLVIGVSIVVIVSSLVHRSPEPVKSDEPAVQRALRMAIHPLAVPVMINPAGLGLLLLAAAFVRDIPTYFSFFGVVCAIFFIMFGLMVLWGRSKRIPSAVIQIFGEVFAILLVLLVLLFFQSLDHTV